jgi:hypothetical protein
MIGTGVWEFNLGLLLIWCEILKPMFSSRFFPRLARFLLLAVTISYAQAPGTTKSGPLAVEPGVIHFEDVARQAELNFLKVSGGTVHKEFIIETTGNGAVIFDYDNDGWPDIYLPDDRAGLKTEKAEWSAGCSLVDVDRDGRADVFVAR